MTLSSSSERYGDACAPSSGKADEISRPTPAYRKPDQSLITAISHAALQMEMARGNLEAQLALAFQDASLIEMMEAAREQYEFHAEQFFILLKSTTGLDEATLRRLLR